jgi:hypothetical protein
VGALSSNEEVKEIENVVKIFFLEERVIDLASNIGTKNVFVKKYPVSIKNNVTDINNKVLQILTVKGLN